MEGRSKQAKPRLDEQGVQALWGIKITHTCMHTNTVFILMQLNAKCNLMMRPGVGSGPTWLWCWQLKRRTSNSCQLHRHAQHAFQGVAATCCN